MVDPKDAGQVLSEHFERTSLDQFKDRRRRYVPETQGELIPPSEPKETKELILYQREVAPLPLNAYLATALTGLTEGQRELMFAVSKLVVSVCRELDIEVYEPRTATDPVQHPDVSPEEVFKTDRDNVLRSDLVIHIADYPSTGAGAELDFALAALIPIIVISHGDTRVSRMVTGIPALKLIFTYSDLAELELELRERLTEIRPILEERKLSFSEYDMNIVGNKVRVTREELGLTRDDVASHSSGLVTPERLGQIEENKDRLSNPSLLELRALAAILKTTVADFVEPDLNERVLVSIQEWLEGRSVARSPMTERDMKRLMRRFLYRWLDYLEKE